MVAVAIATFLFGLALFTALIKFVTPWGVKAKNATWKRSFMTAIVIWGISFVITFGLSTILAIALI